MAIAMTDNYSEETQGARVCLEKAFDWVGQALRQTPPGSGRYGFADYGAADGGTALALYRMVGEAASGRSLVAVLNDLEGNDFQTLGRNGRRAFGPFGGLVYLSAVSFYEPVAEPDSVDFGFSATAMHWLASEPPELTTHTHANAATDAEAFQAFSRRSQEDWRALLALRAKELKPGGQMICVNLARDDAGRYLGHNGRDHNMHDVLHGLWLDLHRDGVLSETEYRAATFQNFYKSPAEFAAPFEDRTTEAHARGLRVVQMRTEHTPCFYREAFREHGDVERFADGLMRTVRSWSRHTFATALQGREDADRIVDELYARFRERIRQEPQRFSMDYVHNVLWIRKEA